MTVITQHKSIFKPREEVDQLNQWFESMDWIKELKQSAAAKASLGLPSSKDEEYKYSKPSFFNDSLGSFYVETIDRTDLNIKSTEGFVSTNDSHTVVLINGVFSEQQSQILQESEGVYIGSIHRLPPSVSLVNIFNKAADFFADGYTHLNTGMFADVLVIRIPDNVSVNRTLIINECYSNEISNSSSPRIILLAGKNSSIKIIQNCLASGEQKHSAVSVVEVFGEENSNVEWVKIQQGNQTQLRVDQSFVELQKNTHFAMHTFSLSGMYTRNNASVRLLGHNIEAHLNGLYFSGKDSLVDNHTLIDHVAPHCVSHELYKGIAGFNGTAVFNGKVFVRQDAQKTNAFQENKNLLLSDEAHMYAKPQLEIFADDVKCSHGATTGQLDEEALFYLRSRGIGFIEARNILMHAYAAELILKIDNKELQEYLTKLTELNFPD